MSQAPSLTETRKELKFPPLTMDQPLSDTPPATPTSWFSCRAEEYTGPENGYDPMSQVLGRAHHQAEGMVDATREPEHPATF